MSETGTTRETLSYATDIKPLFREKDQQSMSGRFDLWSFEDVSARADAILGRLRSGNMPCDGAWPKARVDLFQQWMDGGKLP